MRAHGLALTALILSGALAGAQTKPGETTPTKPATPTALDRYLANWEAAMKNVESLAAEVNRIDKDTTFNKTSKFKGYALYMKAGKGTTALNLALLEMKLEGKTDIADKFICTGTFIYRFAPSTKEILAYELPKPKPGTVADDSVLSLMFGMPAAEVKKRFEMKLAKEDDWYVFIDITPRSKEDKVDFTRARVVLYKNSYLPRMLWFEQPNGSESTWDIPRIDLKAKIERSMFDAPRTPPGWKMVQVPKDADAPPKVIKP
jgi:TIGR03009 family protein